MDSVHPFNFILLLYYRIIGLVYSFISCIGNDFYLLLLVCSKSWRQHFTKQQQLFGRLPPITKTIKVRRTRHAGHCWRSRDELISDVLLWTPSYGREKAGWPARIDIHQLYVVMGCSPEDLPEAMNGRERWWERVRDIRTDGTTRWWDDDYWFDFVGWVRATYTLRGKLKSLKAYDKTDINTEIV